jgi:predicted transcriptional regulator
VGQATIYIDEQTERKLQHIVEKSGISKSKWIAQLIQQKSATTWPAGITELAGAWKDLPMAEAPELTSKAVKKIGS